MHPIQLAMVYADNLGLDYFPVGKMHADEFVPDNAIAVIGFANIVDVFKTARNLKGEICLFKNTNTDGLEIAGQVDEVLNFLSEESANKLELIKNGSAWVIGVKISAY